MKPVQLVFFPTGEEGWRVMPVAGAPARSPRCILVVPGADVLARNIEISGATPAQSRAAALATLAQDLAAPADQLVCGLGAGEAGRRIVFVASRARLDAWLGAAKVRGFMPDIILPDFALLPIPQAGEAHVAARGEDHVVRTGQTGFTCQPDLAEGLMGSLTPATIDLEPAAILVVQRGAIASAPDLLAGMARRASKALSRSLLWPAAAAAAALVIATAAPWISASRINAATTGLRKEGEAVARAALPNASRIVDARAQLREAAFPRERTGMALEYATGILEGLGRTSGVQLSRLEFSVDGVMHANLSAADLSQLQPLRDHISQLGLRGSETPGESRANSILVDFAVTAAP